MSADPPGICQPHEYFNLDPGVSRSKVEESLDPGPKIILAGSRGSAKEDLLGQATLNLAPQNFQLFTLHEAGVKLQTMHPTGGWGRSAYEL